MSSSLARTVAAELESDDNSEGNTERVPRVRSTVDTIRMVLGLGLIALGVLVANVFDSTLLGLADDTRANIDRLPLWTRDLAAAGLGSVVICGAFVVASWSLLTTRYRRFLLLVSGVALAVAVSLVAGQAVYDLVDEATQSAFAIDVPLFRIEGRDGGLNPADPLLAAATATLVIAGSFLPSGLVRRSGALVVGYAAWSVATVGAPPLAPLVDVGAGLFSGSALLWVFGRHDLALRAPELEGALRGAGLEIRRVEPVAGSPSHRWCATTIAGERVAVRALSRDDRSGDLLVRAYRWLRLRKTGDHRPFLSLRRTVEHEALVSQVAWGAGVATPRVVAVAPAGVDGMILATDWVEGTKCSDLPVLTDEFVAAMWVEASRLHDLRIAHGALCPSSFLERVDGTPALLGFGRGELASTDQRLGADLAELLASTAAIVGRATAIRLALEAVGRRRLERAVPWLQPLALSSATREAIGGAKPLADLRADTASACGVVPDETVNLERVDAKSLFVLATIVVSAWFLVPQLADLESIWSQITGANWGWVAIAVVASLGTYAAATGSLLGALPVRLPYWPAFMAQIASSFANRVTPAKVGGVATNLRYLQRNGVPTAVGVTAIGLNALAGVIMHIVLTVSFLLLASGDNDAEGLTVPSTGTILLLLGVLASIAGGAALVPSTRRLIDTHVLPQLKSGWDAIVTVVRDPVRLLMLFGGSGAITLFYVLAMVASLEAFGSAASAPLVALLFLTGSAIANAAPTPGGLGAAEAALIAALSTIEEAAVVVPAVFLYRLVTFWLPILPGWFALTQLRRTGSL